MMAPAPAPRTRPHRSRQRFIASLQDDPVCARRVERLHESPPDFELVLGAREADPRRIEMKARAGNLLPTDGRAFRAMLLGCAFDLRGASIRCAEKCRAYLRVWSAIGSISKVALLKGGVFTAARCYLRQRRVAVLRIVELAVDEIPVAASERQEQHWRKERDGQVRA
jgi:hypothetical protein